LLTALPTGRLLITVRAPGRRTVRLPLMAWQGDELAFNFSVPTDAELGADFVFVPPGEYTRGGDPDAVLAGPARLVHVDAFAIGRHPITVGEYFAWLDTLELAEALRRAPRENGRVMLGPDAEGRWQVPARDIDGDWWAPDWPVCGVSYDDALAYAAWRSARDGARYRLPTEDEWEKAARGPDGRFYPWGDHFDVTWCSVRGSVPGNPMPKPVGHFATDVSPYGVHDMGGGVREWVDGWFEPDQRIIRGGSFSLYGVFSRAAGRWGAGPSKTQASIGFRLVKQLGR
ncbi:MAG: SUMF1/EgtB/PvdO family nonheme iron enzyme, partial [Myxococcales bacterium]|nr:SUMF1/EgtB/PvdO family nonheme iron enzyme [Myxococcales bacterium]